MPGGSSKSRFMQRCVADVTGQGKDLKGAFAVCTAQSQKSGYSEPGSTKQTGKGKAREKQFKKDPDMGKKARSYEKAVKAGRKSEDMATVFASLDEASKRAPALQEAPRQNASLSLFPKDFTSQGWHTFLYQLGIPEGKAADWKTVQRVEILCKGASVAYEED